MTRRHLTFSAVQIRRRWRAEHAIARRLLDQIGLKRSLLYSWQAGGADDSGAGFSRVIVTALLVDIALSIFFAFLITALIPAEYLSIPLGLLVPGILGCAVGVASARHSGLFPFDSLLKLSQIGGSDAAALLEKSEFRYLMLRRTLLWLPFPLSVLLQTASVGDPASIVGGFLVLIAGGALFALGIISGGRLAVALARSRAQRRVGFFRWLTATVTSLTAWTVGWVLTAAVVTVGLRAVWSVMEHWSDLLSDERWEQVVAKTSATMPIGAQSMVASLQDIYEQRDSIAVVLLAIIVVVCCLGLCVKPSLITSPLSGRLHPAPDAVDRWCATLGRLALRQGGLDRVLARRLHEQRWALAVRFWHLMQPGPEAMFFLGAACGLTSALLGPWSVAAVLALAGCMAVHIQATEIRAELLPTLGVTADRQYIPILLAAPDGSGVRALVNSRSRLLAANLAPSGLLCLALTTWASLASGLNLGLVALVSLVVLCTFFSAPTVQWYMGGMLLVTAYCERDVAQQSTSATAELQSKLQGFPRMVMVVLPSFLLVPIVALQPFVAWVAPAAVVLMMLLTSAVAVPVLRAVGAKLAQVVSDRGLDAWRDA